MAHIRYVGSFNNLEILLLRRCVNTSFSFESVYADDTVTTVSEKMTDWQLTRFHFENYHKILTTYNIFFIYYSGMSVTPLKQLNLDKVKTNESDFIFVTSNDNKKKSVKCDLMATSFCKLYFEIVKYLKNLKYFLRLSS